MALKTLVAGDGVASRKGFQCSSELGADGWVEVTGWTEFFPRGILVVHQLVVARPEVELVLRPGRFRDVDRRMIRPFRTRMEPSA